MKKEDFDKKTEKLDEKDTLFAELLLEITKSLQRLSIYGR